MPGDRMGKTGEIHLLCMRLVLVTELSAGVVWMSSNTSRHSPGVDGPMA